MSDDLFHTSYSSKDRKCFENNGGLYYVFLWLDNFIMPISKLEFTMAYFYFVGRKLLLKKLLKKLWRKWEQKCLRYKSYNTKSQLLNMISILPKTFMMMSSKFQVCRSLR